MLELSDRQRAVLFQVIRGFLETGEPVSSSTVARSGVLSVSSATIRNVMSDLEALGVLNQPHTSAGRAPTARGLRMYVDTLTREGGWIDPFSEKLAAVLGDPAAPASPEGLTRQASALLSQLTRLTAIISMPNMTTVRLRDIHLSLLSSRRVLVLLVTDDDRVLHRVVSTEEDIEALLLIKIQNYLSELVLGLTLDQIRARVRHEMAQVEREYCDFIKAALEISHGALDDLAQPQLHVEGALNVLEYAEFTEDIDRLKELMLVLQERGRVLEVLDRLCDTPGSVMTFIGPELNWELGDDMSLVLCGYQRHGEQVGVVGVLGPMRLDYARIIPAVGSVAQLLSARL